MARLDQKKLRRADSFALLRDLCRLQDGLRLVKLSAAARRDVKQQIKELETELRSRISNTTDAPVRARAISTKGKQS